MPRRRLANRVRRFAGFWRLHRISRNVSRQEAQSCPTPNPAISPKRARSTPSSVRRPPSPNSRSARSPTPAIWPPELRPTASLGSIAGIWDRSRAAPRRTSIARCRSRSSCCPASSGCTTATRWIDGHAGDFLYVPEGGIHAFRNESGAPASILLLFVPGAPREAYFETLGDVAAGRRKMTGEDWAELFARHDNNMV